MTRRLALFVALTCIAMVLVVAPVRERPAAALPWSPPTAIDLFGGLSAVAPSMGFAAFSALSGQAMSVGGQATPFGDGDVAVFITENAETAYGGSRLSMFHPDAAYVERLIRLGYRVEMVSASTADLGVARFADLIVVSPQVQTTVLKQWLKNVSKPVLILKPEVIKNLGLLGADHHYESSKDVNLQAHPMLSGSGLSGTVRLSNTKSVQMGVGDPSDPFEQAEIVARTPSGEPALIVYPMGARMDGEFAQGCRIGFPADKKSAPTYTEAGWRLFDASVSWSRAAGCSPDSPEPAMPADPTGGCNIPPPPSGSGASKNWVDDIVEFNGVLYVGGVFGVMACDIDPETGALEQIWHNSLNGGQVHQLATQGGGVGSAVGLVDIVYARVSGREGCFPCRRSSPTSSSVMSRTSRVAVS